MTVPARPAPRVEGVRLHRRGVAAVLVIRRLTGPFLSMYLNTDVTLVASSVLQAAVWRWWRSGDGGE